MDIAKVSAALLRMDAARIARGVKRRWMDKTFPCGACYRDEVARFDRLCLVRNPWSLGGRGEGLHFRLLATRERQRYGNRRARGECKALVGVGGCEAITS